MTRQRLDKSSLPDPSYQWTTRKAMVFLGALGGGLTIGEAAHRVGMSRQSAYRLRGRLGEDSRFARGWDASLEQGRAVRREQRRAARKATRIAPEDDILGLGK